jgi:hypothetical protein
MARLGLDDVMKKFGLCIFGLVTGLALSGVDAIAESAELAFDLSGAWQLDRTENFEEYLKESGTPWWKRKLAKLGSSRMRQSIKHDGDRFEIESESPVETRTDVIIADGATQRSVKTAAGDMMTWTAHVEGDVLIVDGHGELGHRVVRREIVAGSMVMTIINPDASTQCKLYFKRAPIE